MVVEGMEGLRKILWEGGMVIGSECEEEEIMGENREGLKEEYGEDVEICLDGVIGREEGC